jgi:cyclic 2,3-diphosphoglycerate synthase
VAVIALIDGEHHPEAVRDALAPLDLAGVVFCGGEEKLAPGPLERHYGRPVEVDPEGALRRLAPSADAVVDLADEPVLPPSAKLRLAALALHLGLRYEAPGLRLDPPRYAPVAFDGPKLAVIGTRKRTGKTAVAGHWARLLRERGVDPVMVCMGRGGPAEPRMAAADTGLDDLLALADAGAHAASDYLEDAVLAGVRTVGCRRVGSPRSPTSRRAPRSRPRCRGRARCCSRGRGRAYRRSRSTARCASSAPASRSRWAATRCCARSC